MHAYSLPQDSRLVRGRKVYCLLGVGTTLYNTAVFYLIYSIPECAGTLLEALDLTALKSVNSLLWDSCQALQVN